MNNTKKNNRFFFAVRFGFILLLLTSIVGFTFTQTAYTNNEVVTNDPAEIIWNVKAVHPFGYMIDIKAMDKFGAVFPVKAIQHADQTQLLDIKAFVHGRRLPVKMLVSDGDFTPVKAIGEDGQIYDIKALPPEGGKLDVKGIRRSGNIIHLKAISAEGNLYGVKAISPTGEMNDIKGLKMTKETTETVINGVKVFAHIKAMSQVGPAGPQALWHIKALHPDGYAIPIKAFDKAKNMYDVKAIQDADQRHVLDIKALVKDEKLPIKILASEDKYAPVKAIGPDGTIYDIKAITANGKKLDVKGVSRSGNIIHIKAINKKGEFYGVKAISPKGQLNSVKGVKMENKHVETKINGVEIHAHVKALGV